MPLRIVRILPTLFAVGVLVQTAVSVHGQVAPKTKEVNSKDGLTYVWIPNGTFTMGCSPADNECEDYEKPPHVVTLTKGFWLGQTEVTQGAYNRVIGNSPGPSAVANLPIHGVTWDEAGTYCRVVGGRLPSEAEWEYAARARTTAARYADLNRVAWYSGNSEGQVREVGQKAANGWDLYDMLGNAWEWTADWDGNYQSGESSDPHGPANGNERIVRGGSWASGPEFARGSYRGGVKPGLRNNFVGFRCVAE